MSDQTGGTHPRQQQHREQLSSQELAFLARWRLMINRLGGQKQAAETMDWSTSTVSRDYSGKTLPTNERIRELSNYLNLATDERADLEGLLRQARDSHAGRRKHGASQPPGEHTPPPDRPSVDRPSPEPAGHHRRRWMTAAVAVTVVVAVGVIASVLASSGGSASAPVTGTQEDVQGAYPGEGVKAVPIPVSSLTKSLASEFNKDRTKNAKTVNGYEFRNALNPSLCLTASETGSLAGQDQDPVQVTACKLTANQIWIPEQWDINDQPFTHLVSDQYQTMCLSAQKTGGNTRSGNMVYLLQCAYPAGNQAWAFQTWYQNVAQGHYSFPIFLSNKQSLCLDADQHANAAGNDVRLWDQYAIAGQFWF